MLETALVRSIWKRAVVAGMFVICLTFCLPVSAHPGHGKPMEQSRATEVVWHYLTEPVHMIGTIAAIAVAVACGSLVVRKYRTSE